MQNTKENISILRLKIRTIKMAKYQRPLNEKKVRAIVENYNYHKDHEIDVSYRDGCYWCFDGQHRIRAHQLLGMDDIKARVHYGLSYEQEADLFARQHENEQNVGKRDIWHASVESGDYSPETQDIINICKEMGFRVSIGKSKTENTFHCVRELQSFYSRHGRNGFKTMVFIIKTAWDRQPNNTHRDIVSGLDRLMSAFKLSDAQVNRLRDCLAKITPQVFLQLSVTSNGRGGKYAGVYMARVHNRGLRLDSPNRLNEYMIR